MVGTSAKENERRLPLHPAHLPAIDAEVRERITLETGYGERFGYADSDLAEHVAGFLPRTDLIESSDVVLLPKPQLAEVDLMGPGQTLWGWPHCVQDESLTQSAIDRELTLIAFEVMNHWTREGTVGLHVFHRNNEIAGYSSVLHALALSGLTGVYGSPLRAVVIGFGATARGAVTALNGQGVHDVTVLTNRAVAAVAAPIHSVQIRQFEHDVEAPHLSHVITDAGRVPLAPFLTDVDIVVNCTLQDPAAPLMFLRTEDLAGAPQLSLVVDVSCDEAMGFDWARPTGFDDPMFDVGDGIGYYAVDHSPSYLWRSATWENSRAIAPFLRPVLAGPDSWDADETISRAIEIRDGRVVNPAILAFQGREARYPHEVLRDAAQR